MYIRLCKGNGGTVPFKINEYKIPDFKLLNDDFKEFNNGELYDLLYDMFYGEWAFQIIGSLTDAEMEYLHNFLDERSGDYVNAYGILQQVEPNNWYIYHAAELHNFSDYKRDAKMMYEWAENCEKFVKENG